MNQGARYAELRVKVRRDLAEIVKRRARRNGRTVSGEVAAMINALEEARDDDGQFSNATADRRHAT